MKYIGPCFVHNVFYSPYVSGSQNCTLLSDADIMCDQLTARDHSVFYQREVNICVIYMYSAS